jgi:hypothetical protein
MRSVLLATAAAVALTACAGRDPQFIPAVQPMDAMATCDTITAEIYSNNQRIVMLQKESGDKTAQNVVAGTVGVLLFWPALFMMDFKDAAGKDAMQLQQRQQYLAMMAAQKGCNVAPPGYVGGPPQQPVSAPSGPPQHVVAPSAEPAPTVPPTTATTNPRQLY